MEAIRIPYVINNKLNTRKLKNRLNYQITMLFLFLLANVAVSFGRAGVLIENDGKLITMPDDFNLNRLSGLLNEGGEINENEDAISLHSVLNQNQNKKSVVVNAKKSESETTRNTNNFQVDNNDMDSGEVINLIKSKSDERANSNFNAIYLELLRKLHRALLHKKLSTKTVPTSTLMTSTPSTVDTITTSKLKLKLKNYFENFMHISLAENLQKLLRLVAEDEDEEEPEGTGKNASEKNVNISKANQNNSKTQPDSVPELSESAFGNTLEARKLGINIPLIRVKVDDKVLFQGKAEVKLHLDELNPLTWALVIFTILLLIAIVIGVVFGRSYLQKIDDMPYQNFQNHTQNQRRESNTRSCTSRSVSVRDRERRSSRLPPACRCGCEDDITKSHIADIIREDFDHDSGTSSHMGGSSIV